MEGSTNTAVDHRIQLPKAGSAASVDVVIEKARALASQLSDYVKFLGKNKQEQHVEAGIIRSSVTKEVESLERVKKVLESDVSFPQSDPSSFFSSLVRIPVSREALQRQVKKEDFQS